MQLRGRKHLANKRAGAKALRLVSMDVPGHDGKHSVAGARQALSALALLDVPISAFGSFLPSRC